MFSKGIAQCVNGAKHCTLSLATTTPLTTTTMKMMKAKSTITIVIIDITQVLTMEGRVMTIKEGRLMMPHSFTPCFQVSDFQAKITINPSYAHKLEEIQDTIFFLVLHLCCA
jgi:hypothetical protein